MQSFYFSIHYFSLYMYKHHCTLIWVCEWTSTNFLDMCFSFSLSLLENWNGISIFFVTLCLSMSIWQYFSNQLHIHIDFLFLQNHWQFPPIFFHFSSLLLTIQLHSIYSNILSNSFFFFNHTIFSFSANSSKNIIFDTNKKACTWNSSLLHHLHQFVHHKFMAIETS